MAETEQTDDARPAEAQTATEAGRGRIAKGSFEYSYGESLAQALDLSTWSPAHQVAALYARLEAEIAQAVATERALRRSTRREVLTRLAARPNAPRSAGVSRATLDLVRATHNGVLFTGQLEACDGASYAHDTLPLTVAQVGVCLVSYRGDLGTWAQRLFRRDLRLSGAGPVEEALAILDARRRRAGLANAAERDTLATLGRRGIQTYAERAVLTEQARAPWRMGHGQPAPLELLNGSGSMELLTRSLDLLERLICGHQRFVFVPTATAERHLLTIGDALEPLECAVVDTMQESWQRLIDGGYYDPPFRRRVQEFVNEIGPRVVVGVFRAAPAAPPQVFYAHDEHAELAGLIALADCALQPHRGYPLLLDVAGLMCRTSLGAGTLASPAAVAYAAAGEPWRYGR